MREKNANVLIIMMGLAMTFEGKHMVTSYGIGDYSLFRTGETMPQNLTIFFLPCKLETIGQDFCCTMCHLFSYQKCRCSTKIICECSKS